MFNVEIFRKMGSKFRLALIQLSVGANKSDNLTRAANKISEAVEKGANIVSLPGTVGLMSSIPLPSLKLFDFRML